VSVLPNRTTFLEDNPGRPLLGIIQWRRVVIWPWRNRYMKAIPTNYLGNGSQMVAVLFEQTDLQFLFGRLFQHALL
jgi:hypothetical protein